ncbi:uncharacterized protein LOC112344305 isoform X2 [Selaginella moellendorffii]|uniref:uncharacterized protein LOC112344305 isoform X2 n=1 Tax=Selaginella moellendorffii TaxID=88036 RepID=UPI000D1CB138|nr:uncharacterized protein LOC112344305 isoform X2 [Selaginella moellendorffii]|eukprot:XP_024524529.1 uncharacterized protein LOC112344305 isoform X2 [Selaginella moellendorffii]
MGRWRWRERLRRAALRPLRRWIVGADDCAMDISWSLSGVELRLGKFELIPEAVNAEALLSSPLVLHRASIASARLAFSLIGSPAIAIVIEGLDAECSARDPEDSYWKNTIADRGARQRLEKLASIDPEGATEHSRAKLKEENRTGFFLLLLISFLLSAVKVELHDAKISLRSRQGYEACISSTQLVVGEEMPSGFFKGSMFGSLSNMVVYSRKKATKACSASRVSLTFRDSRRQEQVRGDEGNAVLMVMVWLSFGVWEDSFCGLTVSIPEAVGGLDSSELDLVLLLLAELEGPSGRLTSASSSGGISSPGCRNAKELWAWAVSKVLRESPRRRLSDSFEAGILRRRYCSLYGDWLQNVGWCSKSQRLDRAEHFKKLSSSVAELEKKLPVEAVALARRIARRRVFLKESNAVKQDDVSQGFLKRKWAGFLRAVGYDRDAVEKKWEEQQTSDRKSQDFSLDFSRGSLVFVGAGDVSVCLRWKKMSVAYRSNKDRRETVLVLGSLRGEILSKSIEGRGKFSYETSTECRLRWNDRASSGFLFFSSSPFEHQQAARTLQKYNVGLQEKHASRNYEETRNWQTKLWKHYSDDKKIQRSLDSLVGPFLVVFYGTAPENNRLPDTSMIVTVGKVDMSFRYAMFSKLLPILTELRKLEHSGQSSSKDIHKASTSAHSVYREQMELCRSLVFSAVPETRLQLTAVVENVRLTLEVSETELPIQNVKLKPLVLDVGYIEFALWPAVEHNQWIRPLRLQEQPPTRKDDLDRDSFASNLLVYINGSRFSTQSESFVGPLNVTVESSFQRENCTSLFESLKSVTLTAGLAAPSFDVCLDISKATTAVQILICYFEAAKNAASHLYDSTTESESDNDAISTNETFLLDLSFNLQTFKVYFGDLEASRQSGDTETSLGIGILAVNSLCLDFTAGSWSSTGISLKFQKMQISIVPTNMNFEQVLKGQCKSSLKTFCADHFTLAFDGSEASAAEVEKFCCSTTIDVGLISTAGCHLEQILAKAKQHPSTAESMHVVLTFNDGLSVEVEAGLAIFETIATVDVLNFVASYAECVGKKLERVITSVDGASASASELERSYSFPEGRQLVVAPSRSQSTPPEFLQVEEDFGVEGLMSFKVSRLSVVLSAAGTQTAEGVLFVVGAHADITSAKGSYKIKAAVSQFTAISLRSDKKRLNERSHGRVPQFGFNDTGESSSDTESFHGDTSYKDDDKASDMNCLLDNLTVSATLNRQCRKGVDPKWEKSWRGQIAVSGLNIAVTTYELQMLVSIGTPLSHISLSKSKTANIHKPSGQNVEKILRDTILDGAIVALKDAQEHLYLSVEDSSSQGQFHLGGAWHYSVAGERALFKVKFHEKNKDIQWFSLVSLYAKTSSGVPLRVHYEQGSRQLQISSTNDSPWELWQCIPYRSSDEEINVYNGIFSHLVHLINQKSKQGLALADGIPVVASYPGNAFKIEVVAEPIVLFSQRTTVQENVTAKAAVASATTIPEVRFDIGSIYVTLLHEAAGAIHLLPLVRVRLEEVQGLAQASSQKARIIGGCSSIIEHYEAQTSSWLAIVNPVMMEIIGSSRLARNERKFPVSLFCRFKKVEVLLSELSLDACLFLIGVMDLAGPYTIKHSPVLVNRCQIENQTGLNVLFRFDRESGAGEEGKVNSWQTSSYLMRHVRSRRGTTPAEVSHSVSISLEKAGTGLSSSMNVSLGEPGVFAGRTRLEAFQGSRVNAPGPIVVIDVSKQSQDGIFLTVSPMVKIHNATGLVLQLRCRRPKQGEGGAIVSLKDGDIIDDSMGAFDALNLEGEMKKALLSFNVGNFLLSIRPESVADGTTYDWSEDVKGAKAVRVSGLFDKLQYNFKKTLKSKSLESSFGSVFCKAVNASGTSTAGVNFLIRTLRRQVPVTRLSGDQQQKRSLIAWQEQQELLLLPTLKIYNFLSSGVYVRINSTKEALDGNPNEVSVAGRGGKALLYADLNALFLVIKVDDHGFVSHPIDISSGHKRFQELAKKGGSVKDIDIELAFKDGLHLATLKVYRAEDGVLELVIFTKYMLQNDSQVPILVCAAKAPSRWQGRRVQNLQWPPSTSTHTLIPGSFMSWFPKSSNLLMKRQEESSQPSWIDLNALSGSSELSLGVRTEYLLDKIQLGIRVHVPSQKDSDPSHIVRLAARYTVANESTKPIFVCQAGLEEEESHYVSIDPMCNAAVHAQQMDVSDKEEKPLDCSTLSLRFRLKDAGWRWSGRICAASLGSFFLKLRSSSPGFVEDKKWIFAVVYVEEEDSSLIIHFRLHSREAVPYRIENRLHTSSITFHQKDMPEPDTLPAMASADYVWDDLSLPHRLVVSIAGTQACSEINLDKVKAWKSFAASHRSKGFSLQLPFQGNAGGNDPDDLLDMGYEVYADGPTRVLRVCQKVDSTKKSYWESELSIPRCKVELKIPTFKVIMLEASKQRIEDLTAEELSGSSPFTPFLCAILASSSIETFVTSDHAICQLRVQSLGADMKWQGAPFAAMLRIHDHDRLNSTTTALHAAFVLSNLVANPIQAKYASILIQAFDLNIDEDTLMKFVPFYRTSLSTTGSSLQIYFERFEIHPIKIVASFVPGHPRADYTSAQETFRALLHTVIKLPSVRGATVELNGVLLSHALLTFKQLVMKCFQHYSWYAMRAIYIARGSKLLPPGFSSLFDDSAASSLDVFFDPANGSIDLQGLTLGMFNLLSRGLRKRGQGGTSRYLGDLENTVKKAGSNIVFAVVTELSDNVLKGAETNGFDGMVNGFRRGILNVAMEPLVLQKAVIKGGSTRRIQLDRSVGTDEAYIEGYIQAMLDALFKQDYLKVKVMEDLVILKNLPPNSMLLNEIVACVKNFLISEGLLAGEASIAAVRSMRLLRGESERKVVPAVISLSEQLLVIFAIRGLRQYTRKLLHLQGGSEKAAPEPAKAVVTQEPPQLPRPSFKRTISNFFISSAIAYIDGRLCRHIPNELGRRIVSGFLLSFVE